MTLIVARFCSLLFVSIALAPGLAHLFELPNKIQLGRHEYLLVQQIYRGWSFLGIASIAAIIATTWLAILVRKWPLASTLTLAAVVCLLATQVLFWTFTFPVNQETQNWTQLPDHWMALRSRWEYSHAASAGLNLLALIAIIGAVLVDER